MFGANVEYRIQNTEKRAGGLARSQRRSRWGEGKVHVCTCIHVARGTPDSLYSYVVGLQRRLRDCHPFETVVPAPLCWGKAGQGRAGRQAGRGEACLLSSLNAGPKRYCIMSRTALPLLL